jgi:hypothetical protein
MHAWLRLLRRAGTIVVDMIFFMYTLIGGLHAILRKGLESTTKYDKIQLKSS